MFPPLFVTCAADAGVQAVLGTTPRLYPFGEAPQNVTKPYAVWQLVSGSPENYLDRTPDIDLYSIQLDCYAQTVDESRNVAEALRDAIEPHAHVINWGGEIRDPETNLFRYILTVDWWVHR